MAARSQPVSAREIRERLREHSVELQELGVVALYLFGSTAQGEASAESDLDFVVQFRNSPTFARYMDLQLFLGTSSRLGAEEGRVLFPQSRPDDGRAPRYADCLTSSPRR